MHLVHSVAALRRLVARWRRRGDRIGLVPTMGYLHAGHLSLVRRAKRELPPPGRVVLSIYVNPTQFGPNEDFSRYPRDLKRDLKLCRQARVDAVFAPPDSQMYPGRARGDYTTCVVEESLSLGMEGKSRPGHFRGVTTVVAKLFNIVQPDVAVFGAKDFQQAAVLKRMVRDLNFPLKMIVSPTLREPDGLAMSSRNRYLEGDLRRQALVLSRAIARARSAARARGVSAAKLKLELKRLIEREPEARLDYAEFFDPETLRPSNTARRGTHLALAVFVGKTRLIDNGQL
jgi:pantoate--beta-alanine ligase